MWVKLNREDESTYPPPYKRLLFCNVLPTCFSRGGVDMYEGERPFYVMRTKYDLFSGVYIPDYRCRRNPDMTDFPLLTLFDDYERIVNSRVHYWQLAPEPPVEIVDLIEPIFRSANEDCV